MKCLPARNNEILGYPSNGRMAGATLGPGRPVAKARVCEQVGSRPAARTSASVGAAASRSDIDGSAGSGSQRMPMAGSVAAMACPAARHTASSTDT